MDIRYSNSTQLSNHSQMDIRYSLIKRPSNDIPDGYSIFEYQISICEVLRWIFDMRMSNIHLTSSQMDIQYSNIKRPSDDLPDGYSIFECQTNSNIEYPSGSWSDGRLIFECRISIWEDVRWTFGIRISNIHLGAGEMDV